MEENDVKSLCGGTMLQFKNKKDGKIFDSKSDGAKNFQFKS